MTDILTRLAALTDVSLITADAEMAGHLVDWRRRHFGKAIAVVQPSNTKAVAAVMRACSETGTRVFPQGGNTSVCGGSVPDDGGNSIVLSLSRMSRIRSVSADDDSMVVEAGCVLQTVQEAAAHIDRLFPMSLGAEGSCQIGGNVATNVGGTAVVRYGNMRDLVLGLEVVLPDGTIWNGLRTLRKNNSGYDLKNLFIGSEGTLGIVTAAALRLFPRPRNIMTAMLAVNDTDETLALAREIRMAFPGEVSGLEIISNSQMKIVLHHTHAQKLALAHDAEWYLLVELSGATPDDQQEERLITLLEERLENGVVLDTVLATSSRQREELWALRHNVTEGNVRQGMGLTHDIAVPLAHIGAFLERAGAFLAENHPQAVPVVVGHLGDGNLHYIAMFEHEFWAAVEDKPGFASRVGHGLYDIAASLNGTFSAEHGIGAIHTGDMSRYKPAEELAIMRGIKALFDPKGLMNPGRVLPH